MRLRAAFRGLRPWNRTLRSGTDQEAILKRRAALERRRASSRVSLCSCAESLYVLHAVLVSEPSSTLCEQYERGDRLPLRHRWVLRVVAEQRELFRMEFAPEPVDLK